MGRGTGDGGRGTWDGGRGTWDGGHRMGDMGWGDMGWGCPKSPGYGPKLRQQRVPCPGKGAGPQDGNGTENFSGIKLPEHLHVYHLAAYLCYPAIEKLHYPLALSQVPASFPRYHRFCVHRVCSNGYSAAKTSRRWEAFTKQTSKQKEEKSCRSLGKPGAVHIPLRPPRTSGVIRKDEWERK